MENLTNKRNALFEEIASLQQEKIAFNNSIDPKIKILKSQFVSIEQEIMLIQKPKFKTDIKFADYCCVLMKDGSKKITKNYGDLDIERELNADEYVDFVQELGFCVRAKISHWDNAPLLITKIIKGSGGYVQPSFWRNTNPTKHFPNGSLASFYHHKLVVDNPTEFWHYKFKGYVPRQFA